MCLSFTVPVDLHIPWNKTKAALARVSPLGGSSVLRFSNREDGETTMKRQCPHVAVVVVRQSLLGPMRQVPWIVLSAFVLNVMIIWIFRQIVLFCR